MKKLLVVLLTLALCVTALTSCDAVNKVKDGFLNLIGKGPKEETPAVTYNVEAAADYIFNLYQSKSITAADFEVTAKVALFDDASAQTVSYDVTWAVDTDKVTITKKDDNTYIVNVDEESKEEVAYVLTATVTAADGTKATKSFNLTVPVYVLWSHEEYMAAEKDTEVVIKGVVVAMTSKSMNNKYNHLFLADLQGKGGYYCYSISQDPVADLGIEVGMTVEVSAPISPKYGMQQTYGGSARIVDSTKKDISAYDITDMFAAGTSLKNYVGMPVTIKGVIIKGQALEKDTDQYLHFQLGDKASYLRTYVSDFPTSFGDVTFADNVYSSPSKKVIDDAHAAHRDWRANVTGILVLYDSNPYLIPMSVNCFEYLEEVIVTPADKVADTLKELKVESSFSSDTVIDLPANGTAYADVTLAWESDSDKAVIADGKLTITVPDEAVTVNLTVTATCGEATATKTFAVKLSKTITPIKDIIDMGAAMEHDKYTTDKYLVAGIITEVYQTTYGNMKIKDEFGNILTIYGTYMDGKKYGDVEGAKPVAGDYVVLSGIVGQYKDTPQVKNADILSFTTPTSVKDAIDLGAAQESYTTDKYLVTGVITEVYQTKYGNMRITDAEGNILTIYGTYSATGTLRYDALEVKPVAGDTVTILGVLGQYNGAAQIQNGWIVAHTAATPETPETPENPENPETPDTPANPETPETPDLSTTKGIYDAASKLANDVTLEGTYTMTGVIASVDTVYSAEHGNVTVSIVVDGYTFKCYRLAGTGADVIAVGDTITVTGSIGAYYNAPQFVQGCTLVSYEKAPVVDEPVDGTKVTVVMSEYAAANSWADATKYLSVTMDENITVTVAGGSNTGKYYNNGSNWRIYQGENPTITIAAANGKTIKSVKFTYASQNTGVITMNGTNVANTAVVEVNAASVEFGVGNTGSATNGQARITAIEVIYA